MTLDDIIDKLKPRWFSFIFIGIILAAQQVVILIYSVHYLGLDFSGDTEQLAIQLFHWMTTSTDPMAMLFHASQVIGRLEIPLVFVGVFLFVLKWREDRNQKRCV